MLALRLLFCTFAPLLSAFATHDVPAGGNRYFLIVTGQPLRLAGGRHQAPPPTAVGRAATEKWLVPGCVGS